MFGCLRGAGALAVAALLGAAGFGQSSAGRSADSALLGDLPVVEAASLHTQTLNEAPANVTVITGEDIRRWGYRTLADALASVRGFYVTDDRSYRYVGVRGFSLPGDYNTRFLVMVNGHSLTENVYGSNNYFGQDFGLDMDLVKRIEIIRGPSSALYGSNGMFATVNIITKSPVEAEMVRVSTEVDSLGEKKTSVGTSMNLGRGANLLLEGSVFNNGGQDFYFPEFESPETQGGWARGVDGERGYHTFTNFVWRNWSIVGFFSSREKNYPTPSYGTIFADRGNKIRDTRDFVEAAWSRDIGATGKLRWRFYYDQHGYWGRYDMPAGAEIQDNRDRSLGNWAGSQITYRFELPRHLGALTVGSEFNSDIRTLQQNYDVRPSIFEYLNLNDREMGGAAFFQHEWQFHRWIVDYGLRMDQSRRNRSSLAPRLAVLHQASPKTVYKLVAGIAFRNPTAYEEFYDDNGFSQLPNPSLLPERMQSMEASVERKIGTGVNVVGLVHQYWLSHLIEAVQRENAVWQYQNVSRYRGRGAEFELNGSFWQGFEGAVSVSLTEIDKARDSWKRAVNSPTCNLKARLAAPLLQRRLILAGTFQYLSSRLTVDGDPLPRVYLANMTVTAARVHPDFDLQFGVLNLFNGRAWDPASPGQGIDRLARDGRSVFLKLLWHTRR